MQTLPNDLMKFLIYSIKARKKTSDGSAHCHKDNKIED